MNFFYFKPKSFAPIQVVIIKVSSNDEYEMVESFSNEIFQILYDNKDVDSSTILLISVIKDYDKSIKNLVIPSTKSNERLTDRCHQAVDFTNSIIVETIKNNDTEYFIEVKNDKILIHQKRINLMSLIGFYKI